LKTNFLVRSLIQFPKSDHKLTLPGQVEAFQSRDKDIIPCVGVGTDHGLSSARPPKVLLTTAKGLWPIYTECLLI
ncbi:MAG: hypothetical protein AAF694_04070, partial [Bacteroidota bacterium]